MAKDGAAVADVVNARMKDLKMTQTALMERAGLSKSTVREIRGGVVRENRSTHTLQAISQALGWRADYLHKVEAGENPSAEAEPTAEEALKNHIVDIMQTHLGAQTAILTEMNHTLNRLADAFLPKSPDHLPPHID
ncbi:helix-turn-helix transcriptional regulator [Actinokineospora sp. NBRC 105648]|uniref:helix-turn-helix domain-containing protein n=1 Tax=Actinokineospora sp. NBRC 105648 TaxID=3032206 RepID=UPI0024A3E35A|nr:helix-turn-helix transcriptional regulator [Actinokineospora sp. NBRC 105648]GLZ41620.1 hypothetical protein Acsp05_52440 [Actinokineospora sp. NBRC 105648]